MTDSPFSQWLDKAMERYGTNQSRIASRAGLSRTSLHKYMTGVVSPRRRNVEAIVDALLAKAPDVTSETRAAILNEALTAAGLAANTPATRPGDPIDALLSDESLIDFVGYEAGFDDMQTPFTEEEKRQLRAGVSAFIRAWVEQTRGVKRDPPHKK